MKFRNIIQEILALIFIMPIIYSANCGGDVTCNCGDTITSNYIMNEDLECVGNGLLLKANLDCKGNKIIGSSLGNGLIIDGDKNKIVENCNIENFDRGINIKMRSEGKSAGWGAFYTVYYYPENTQIKNNVFKNNNYGIFAQDSKSDLIYSNKFINNTYFGVELRGYSSKVWNNQFFNTSIHYTQTSGKTFCENNVSNVYFNGAKGPKCDCISLFDNLEINSNVKICEDKYLIPNGIKLSSNVKLDCNNAQIIGNGQGDAILFKAVKNSQINNCQISNFNNGIYYTYTSKISGMATIYYNSKNNSVENSTITNVNNGLYMYYYSYSGNNLAENIHNTKIIARNYNIYNNLDYLINATNNWWGTLNESLIESKFAKPEFMLYKPFITEGKEFDLSITENDIIFDKENNVININIHKNIELLKVDKLEVEILDFFDYKIVSKKKVNIYDLIDDKIVLKVNMNIYDNHEYHIILDPKNLLNESSKENNYLKIKLLNPKKYSLKIDTGILILNKKLEDYLKKELGVENYVKDNSNAQLIIDIQTDKLNLNRLIRNQKPYEAIIESSFKNINLKCVDIDGCIAGVKKIVEIKEDLLSSNLDFNFIINRTNLEAIAISDYLWQNENFVYYKTNTNMFEKILDDILENNLYQIKQYTIPINIENKTSNYKMEKLIPKNSLKYQKYIDKDSYPIVMAGGLWSDITTWKELGRELSNEGYQVYLIELTGGEELECENCYNYKYEDLIQTIYPAYLNEVLNLSLSSKLKYIGHSNGARVALDSLNLGNFDSSKIDTLIAVGVPGAFEELSFFAKIIKDSGDDAIDKLKTKNITHVTISRISHELNSGTGEIVALLSNGLNQKISVNLFEQYYNWIKNNDDEQPGMGLNLDYFALLYGNKYNSNNDIIVSVEDEKKIFSNIISDNKYLKDFNSFHVGMSTNEKIKKEIKLLLNKEIYKK